GLPLVILGILLSYNVVLIQIGIWVFSLAVFFQLVTLPVEFNASSRALGMLERYGILGQQEIEGSKKVLSAAAMTYVAAAAASILQLLRLVMLFGNRSRD
ncbi:MAG: zinc metallopeptidase, partial [Lachnospiraceae bacterium]